MSTTPPQPGKFPSALMLAILQAQLAEVNVHLAAGADLQDLAMHLQAAIHSLLTAKG